MPLYDSFQWQGNDFFAQVALSAGKINNHSRIRKFGAVENVNSGIATHIWGYGDVEPIYGWPTTASIDSLTSDNAGDTQDVEILGLDENWAEVTQTVTLTGQTRAALTTNLIRVNRMENVSAGTDFAGDIYLFENTALSGGIPVDTSKVKGFITNGDNQTLQGFYSVPAGKTALILQYGTTLLGTNSTVITVMEAFVRLFGMTFNLKDRYVLSRSGTSARDETFPVPGIFPEKSDFILRMTPSANASGASGNAHILLIDNALLAARS
jgi:hypothetical protein